MPNLTPDEKIALQDALRNLDYPAPREKLIELAKENNAPRRALELLLELPETADFHDASQLRDALGIDVPGVQPRGGWE